MVRAVGSHLPEWGALPVEAYMIRHWNYQSTEQPMEQRLRLVSNFLQIEKIPREYYDKTHPDFRLATQDEVNKILLTWRSDAVRKMAYHIWERQSCFPFVVRAWYEHNVPQHEQKMAEWMNVFRNLNSKRGYTIIEGKELFVFSQNDGPNYWRTIYAQLPELAGPELIRSSDFSATRWEGLPPWSDDLLEKFKEDIAYNKNKNPRLWKIDPEHVIEACAARIHRACAYHPIILLDKEAFYGGKPLLMYMDNHTNVIRKVRVTINLTSLINICEDWFERKITPWMWQNSEVGAMWKINGEMGQPVYQLTAEDMAPPVGEYMQINKKLYFIPGQASAPQSPSTEQASSSSTVRLPFRPRGVTKRVSPRKRTSSLSQRIAAIRGLPLDRRSLPSTARKQSSTEPPTPTEEGPAMDESL